jgi:mono/diheme cytochrome c family protein
MSVHSQSVPTVTPTAPKRKPLMPILLGVSLGVIGLVIVGAVLVGPWVLGKRGDLPLERAYGDFAVSTISRIGGGNRTNPASNDRRALAAGREAYTGSCSVCHGASGDGRGVFGTTSYPNATDLRSHDAAEKSDAQLFWIIQNGLNFTGMPGFAGQYSDQDIWSLVTYIRALQDPSAVPQFGSGQPAPARTADNAGAGDRNQRPPDGGGNGGRGPGGGPPAGGPGAPPSGPGGAGARGNQAFTLAPLQIDEPTPAQLDVADPLSTDAAARGASLYFAQGCHLCHGAVGVAPGDLNITRSNTNEASRAIRQGRPGMPTYTPNLLSDAELSDMQAYLATWRSGVTR